MADSIHYGIVILGRQKDRYVASVPASPSTTETHSTFATDACGRPIMRFLTTGNISDTIGPRAFVASSPTAKRILADHAYDADWFRDALKDTNIVLVMSPGPNTCSNARW